MAVADTLGEAETGVSLFITLLIIFFVLSNWDTISGAFKGIMSAFGGSSNSTASGYTSSTDQQSFGSGVASSAGAAAGTAGAGGAIAAQTAPVAVEAISAEQAVF